MKFKKMKSKKRLKNMGNVPELKLSYQETPIEKIPLVETEAIVKFLRKVFCEDTFLLQEEVIILLLNGNEFPLGYMKIANGSQSEVNYEPKNIIRAILLSGASSFVIAHNHPNGIAKPSNGDLDSSYHLLQLTRLFDINYLDDIILTEDSYYSMSDESLIWELH